MNSRWNAAIYGSLVSSISNDSMQIWLKIGKNYSFLDEPFIQIQIMVKDWFRDKILTHTHFTHENLRLDWRRFFFFSLLILFDSYMFSSYWLWLKKWKKNLPKTYNFEQKCYDYERFIHRCHTAITFILFSHIQLNKCMEIELSNLKPNGWYLVDICLRAITPKSFLQKYNLEFFESYRRGSYELKLRLFCTVFFCHFFINLFINPSLIYYMRI